VARLLGPDLNCDVCACRSQIGSGALPVETLPSAGLRIMGPSEGALLRLAAALRGLPRPVIGRLKEGALLLDLRCLTDEAAFLETLAALPPQTCA
jgi:L-seryl-tRNA(Ser) seleniumtransferase